jgi:hypothetical protein
VNQFLYFLGAIALFVGVFVVSFAIGVSFPGGSILLAVIAAPVIATVWVKLGIRTGKWLWWNVRTAPLTRMEGVVALAALSMIAAGVAVFGSLGWRFSSGPSG